jgi:hypothetical protein
MIKYKERLDKVSLEYNVEGVKWDIVCGNTLNVSRFGRKMDFVVGDPPCVRVHRV